ncbi:MAG: DUF86 domain-containing protein [Nitrospira sp.]|nr:DUF86 domain-containing protein [Nitrospira sp.]
MNIDIDRLTTYVSEIKASLNTLREYSKLEKQAFLSSAVNIRDTKYCFIIAGQAAIDICYHLTAKLLKKAPADYSSCFDLLGETGYFNKETLKKMTIMAKFRNLLVHHYIKVDDERVYEKLYEIDCFEEFINDLKKLVNQ